MPSDVFRPRLPLDPFAAVDVRAPWLVPHDLPHSPPQVLLVLGEPPPSELLPLLTSPHLARSLVLIASHAPPPLPLLSATTPGPAVRLLRLSAPLSIHNAGALRLVAVLEKAHRVAVNWLQHLDHAAPRVVQLAESPKTGEFAIAESVVYLSPPSAGVSSAAAIASVDPRTGDKNNTHHRHHTAHGSGIAVPGAGPSLQALPTDHTPPRQLRYPSPAPSVADSFSSSRPTSSYSVSSGHGGFTTPPKRLHRSMRSTSSRSSISSAHSPPVSNSFASNAHISPFAASPKPYKNKSKQGAQHARRAFDAILNFLPAGVPDKQLLKHAILVTTLGVRYLETDVGLPSGCSLLDKGSDSTGYATDTSVKKPPTASKRFSTLSAFSFGSSSPSSSTPHSTLDLLAFQVGSSSSPPSLRNATSTASLLNTDGKKKERPRSSYHEPTTYNGGKATEADVEGDGTVVKERKKSVRKRISAFLGTGDEKCVKTPDAVYSKDETARLSGSGLEKRIGEEQKGTMALTAHVVHILPSGWVDYELSSAASSRRSSIVDVDVHLSVEWSAGSANRKGKLIGKPKLVQSVEQFLLSFTYPLGSLGALGSDGKRMFMREKENVRDSIGRPPRPPPSAFPGSSRSSSLGSIAGVAVSGDLEFQRQSQPQPHHHHQQQHSHDLGGRLAALAKQHAHRPVPYLVAPGVWASPIPYEGAKEGDAEHAASSALTYGEALLLGALDVDPVTGSRAGTGRAWVGQGDVHVAGGTAISSSPNVLAPPLLSPLTPLIPSITTASSFATIAPSSTIVTPQAIALEGDDMVPAEGPERYRHPHVLPYPPHPHAHPHETHISGTAESDTPPSSAFASKVLEMDMQVRQLPTPPESGSSSEESVGGEEEGNDSESTEKEKKTHESKANAEPLPPLDIALARRPTRNHRPAPSPPSIHSPVLEALENLALSPADPAPPPRIAVSVAAAVVPGAFTAAPAFPEMKGLADQLALVEDARPARPRTVHVSDARRDPTTGDIGLGADGMGSSRNRRASVSTSALVRGSGAKGGMSGDGERGKQKGYTQGLQAAWRRIAVWRGGKEKGTLKA